MLVTKHLTVAIDFYCIFFITVEVNCLVAHIFQNIFFVLKDERNSYRFVMRWGWVNSDNFISGELSL